MKIMSNEEKAQIALGVKFQCRYCGTVEKLRTIWKTIWGPPICRVCSQHGEDMDNRYL